MSITTNQLQIVTSRLRLPAIDRSRVVTLCMVQDKYCDLHAIDVYYDNFKNYNSLYSLKEMDISGKICLLY